MRNTADTVAGAPDSLLDFALERYLARDAASAARACGALLERLPDDAAAWFVAGLCCCALGEADAAALALHASFHWARSKGQLALAAAAALELGAYGDNTQDRLERLAVYYLAGTNATQLPPPLPLKRPLLPWAASIAASEVASRLAALADQEFPEWSTSGDHRPAPKAPWAALDAKGLAELLMRFKVAFSRAETTLVQEDTAGNEVFLMAWGSAIVHRAAAGGAPTTLAVLTGGDIFGEMAAITRTPRTANVTTQCASVVLVAGAAAIDDVVARHPKVGAGLVAHCRRRMVENLFAASQVLRVVEEPDRVRLLRCFETVAFEAGDVVMRPGEAPDGLHVVALGRLKVSEERSAVVRASARHLSIGDVVGETAIVLRRPSTALVTALIPTVTLRLPRDRFLRIVEEHPLVLRELYAMAMKREEDSAGLPDASTCTARDIVLV